MNARHWWSLSTVERDLGYSSSWQQTEPLKHGPCFRSPRCNLVQLWEQQWHPYFPKTLTLLPRGSPISSACCLQTGPLWMMPCVVSGFRNAAHRSCCCSCWSFRSSKLASFSYTSLSWLRAVRFSGAHLTIRFLHQLISKGALDSNSMSPTSLCIHVKSASLNALLLDDVSTCGCVFWTRPPS